MYWGRTNKKHSGAPAQICVAFCTFIFFWSVSLIFFISHYLLIDLNTHASRPRFCGVMSGLAETSPLVIIFYSLSVEIKWNNPCNKMAKILMDYNSSKLASYIRYPRRVFCYQESCLVFSRFMYLNNFFALYQWETTGDSFLTVHSLLFLQLYFHFSRSALEIHFSKELWSEMQDVPPGLTLWPITGGVHLPNPSAIFLHLSD